MDVLAWFDLSAGSAPIGPAGGAEMPLVQQVLLYLVVVVGVVLSEAVAMARTVGPSPSTSTGPGCSSPASWPWSCSPAVWREIGSRTRPACWCRWAWPRRAACSGACSWPGRRSRSAAEGDQVGLPALAATGSGRRGSRRGWTPMSTKAARASAGMPSATATRGPSSTRPALVRRSITQRAGDEQRRWARRWSWRCWPGPCSGHW